MEANYRAVGGQDREPIHCEDRCGIEEADATVFGLAGLMDSGTVNKLLMADLRKPRNELLAMFVAWQPTNRCAKYIGRSLDSWFDTFSERLL